MNNKGIKPQVIKNCLPCLLVGVVSVLVGIVKDYGIATNLHKDYGIATNLYKYLKSNSFLKIFFSKNDPNINDNMWAFSVEPWPNALRNKVYRLQTEGNLLKKCSILL